jgi:hypothetical protein
MLRRIREIQRYMLIYLDIGKNLLVFVCASKGESTKTTGQG